MGENKKNKIYLLVLAVIVIYALIAFQLKNHFVGGELTENGVSVKKMDKNTIPNIERKKVDLNFRDPFLNASFIENQPPQKKSEIKSTGKPKASIIKSTNANWEKIELLAIISNSYSNTCVVKIEGKEMILKTSEIFENFEVVKIFSDSVKFKKNNTIKTFYIKK